LDFGSVKFKLWMYFGLFALFIMLTIWALQVLFLSNYYEAMKASETEKIADKIESSYSPNTTPSQLTSLITGLRQGDDIYIQIDSKDGKPLYISYSVDNQNAGGGTEEAATGDGADGNTADGDAEAAGSEEGIATGESEAEIRQDAPSEDAAALTEAPEHITVFDEEIALLKGALIANGGKNITRISTNPATMLKISEYAAFLDNGDFLYILSPLYPMHTTLSILTKQLLCVTIISLLAAFALSYYLSATITNPITEITNSAKKMADGEFGIGFVGKHYTEVKSLANTLATASIEVEHARNAQRDIIANVSHDLKTPLTMIRSYAEMIQDISGDDPEKRNEHLAVIISETERLNLLITEFQDISKLKSGEAQGVFTVFSMSGLAESTANNYRSFAEQNGYTLGVKLGGRGFVNGDENRIAQVLNNLLSNAMKYGGENKSIEIAVIEKPGENIVRVEVSDHGIGIPKEELAHIWTRYYKASSNYRRTDDNSTGLGLSIVKEILLLHGAEYGVESVPGSGSTFWFEMKGENTDG
jgi:signal transduction histidine kinase